MKKKTKKHRHLWHLTWADGGTCGMGLIYSCRKCSAVLEYRLRKPSIKQLEVVVKDLLYHLKTISK